jgi:P-type Ca2+ transporter type 2C
MLVQLFTLAGQIVIIFKGGEPFQTEPLTGAQWGWTIFFGALTLPLGAAIRSIPDSFFLAVTRRLKPVTGPFSNQLGRLRGKVSKNGNVVEDHRKERAEEYFFGDLEDDEERKIRRFRWRWWTRSNMKTKDGVATAIASAGLDIGGQNMAVRFQRQLSQKRTGTGISGAAEAEKTDNGGIDLERWIEMAKNSPSECPYGLEVHLATAKGDPVIMREVVGGRIPPSQNKEVRRFLGR